MNPIKLFSMPEILDKQEALGEHLYSKVSEITQLQDVNLNGKITGILLGKEEKEIFDLLQNNKLLQNEIKRILSDECQSSHCEDDVSEVQSDEDMLYSVIQSTNPENCSKLTGMILELGQETVRHLLENRDKLVEVLKKAEAAIESEKLDDHGDILYKKIAPLYPHQAEKLTGMMLELDPTVIETLLTDEKVFSQYLQKAYQALNQVQN